MSGPDRARRRGRIKLAVVAVIWFFTVCLTVAGINALLDRRAGDPGASTVAASPAPTMALPASPRATSRTAATPGGALTQALVVGVVDGDTLDVSIAGRTYPVRLIGINTPETGGPYRAAECFGSEASGQAARLVDGAQGRIYLERDVSDVDQYGRLLRHVWLDEAAGRRLLSEALVAQGYARVYTFEPDVRYRDRLVTAERLARARGAGLWSACDTH